MISDSHFEKLALALALGLPCAASLTLMLWAPGVVSPSTYAAAMSLLMGTAAIGLKTWRSAQATQNVEHVLYDTDHPQAGPDGSVTRWERFTRRYDRSAARV